MKRCEAFVWTFVVTPLMVIAFMLMVAGFAPKASAQTLINACGTIDTSGSYVLTKNLTAEDICLTIGGLSATGNIDVTLDLNGFTIDAPAAIHIPDSNPPNSIVVRNGIALGSIDLLNAQYVRVEDMMVIGQNQPSTGINAGGMNSLIANNQVKGFSIGIAATGIITGNIVTHNTTEPYGWGIVGFPESTVSNNVANRNNVGIVANYPCRVTGNTAVRNLETDIGLRFWFADKDRIQQENTFGKINLTYTWED